MWNNVLIARNVRLTFKFSAKEIYVSPRGEITIVVPRLCMIKGAKVPKVKAEYLESLCCDLYFGGKPRENAIASILLLNRLLSKREYGDFYDSLRSNLDSHTFTIISSDLF